MGLYAQGHARVDSQDSATEPAADLDAGSCGPDGVTANGAFRQVRAMTAGRDGALGDARAIP